MMKSHPSSIQKPGRSDLSQPKVLRTSVLGTVLRRTSTLVTPLLSLLALPPVQAADAELDAATSYLLESSAAYGSWGTLPLRDTGKVLQALQARGEQPDPNGLQAAWLANADPVALDLRLRVWQALALLDQTPEQAFDLLESAQNPDGGYSFFGAGGPSSLQETVLALQLMDEAGYSDLAQVSAALTYVKGKVQTGGGYGYEDNEPSIAVTVEVIQAYQRWRSVFSLESQVSAGIGWLASQQQSDGYFGTGPHATLDTAMTLCVSGGESGLSISAWSLGASALASSQEPAGTTACSGSWDCDPYTTAWALLALEKVKPDLVVEQLSVTSPSPILESSSVTVQAVVRNQGLSASSSGALVGVVVKDPTLGTSTALGQALLSGIQPGSTQTVTVTWDTTGVNGPQYLEATADLTGKVSESNEGNNSLSSAVTITPRVDLAIGDADVSYSPENPGLTESITFEARVSNGGGTSAAGVVRFILDPEGEASLLSEQTISLAAGESKRLTTSTLLAVGEHSVEVVLDPDDLLDEGIETNNRAAVSLTMKERMDLMLVSEQIYVSPSSVIEPENVQVAATLYNQREDEAENVAVQVSMYDSDTMTSFGQAVPLKTEVVDSVPGNSARTVYITVPTAGYPGNNYLIVTADPSNQLDETLEDNNTSYARVVVTAQGNFNTTPTDLGLSPSTTTESASVRITLNVRNNGGGTLPASVVRITATSPSGVSQTLGTVNLPSLAGNTTVGAVVDWNTTGAAAGSWTITGTVDPDNSVAEKLETDNSASKSFTLNPRADLSVVSGDISFSPASPEEGDAVTISATVRNLSTTSISSASTFLVRFFDGNPSSGGTLIGEVPRAGLTANSSFVASTSWPTLNLDGAHTIYVQVDPTKVVSELVTSNNEANKALTVQAASRPDLQVLSSSLSLTPATGVAPGATVTVAGTLQNLRDFAASNVGVRLYAGDPTAGGVPIASQSVSVPALGSTPVSFSWTTPTSAYTNTVLYLVADPDKLVAEPDETNNTGSIAYRGRAGSETTPQNLVASLSYHNVSLSWNAPADVSTVSGYRLYRNGTLLNPAGDVTSGAVASADSQSSTSYPASNAIDSSTSTYWQSANHAAPWWLELSLAQPQLVSRVTLMWYSAYRGSNYQVQGWDGSAWKTLATITGNTSNTVTHDLSTWMTTQRVRIYVTTGASSSYAALYDVKVTGADPLSSRTYADLDLLSSDYGYVVTAVTSSGFESPDSNKASVSVLLPDAVSGLQALPDYTQVDLRWTTTSEPLPYYYLLSRDGVRLGDDSKVSGGTAVGDSVYTTSYTADKARDGSSSTYWMSASHAAPWSWELTFSTTQLVTRLELSWHNSYRATDYEVQGWDGRRWRTLSAVVNNTNNLVSHVLSQPFPTLKVRVYITKAISSYVGLYEADVWSAPPVTSASYTDTYLLHGPYAYEVAVMNYLGELGPVSSVEAVVPAPIPPASLNASVGENVANLSWPAVNNPTATSYLLYRDNSLLLPVGEQRTGGTGVGDSVYTSSYTADKALDGNTSTYWMSASHSAPWTWELSWPSARVLTKATVLWHSSYLGQDYELQGWDGKFWRTLGSVKGNSSVSVSTTLRPMSTQKLRVYITKANSSYVGIYEFNVEGLAPYTGLSYADANVPGGPHTYEVSVINTLGEESTRRSSLQTIPIPAPGGLTASVDGDDVSLVWTASSASKLVGYHLYRSGQLLNGPGSTNLSLSGASASASSTYAGYSPGAAIDNNTSSAWFGLADQVRWSYELQWASPRTLAGVSLLWYSGYAGIDYAVQARVGGQWITQATVSGNSFTSVTHSFPGVTTDGLRLLIQRAGNTYPGIYELRALAPAPITGLTSLDRAVPSGSWTYEVRAVDSLGGESAPAQANAVVGNLQPPSNLVASATSTTVNLSWSASPSSGILGYYLYRDDLLLNPQPEVTTPATASASSVYSTSTSYQASNAIDNNPSTYWHSATGTTGWTYTLEWPQARRISQLTIAWYASYRAVNYDIQRWNGSAYVTELEVRGNTENTPVHKLANFNASTRLRINILSTVSTYAAIYELDALEATPITTLSSVDGVRDNGEYRYTARAVSNDFISAPSNGASATIQDTTPPAAPSGFKVNSYTSTSVTLGWTASSDVDAFRYKLYYSDTTTLLATVNALSYTHGNVLNAGQTSYTWYLKVLDRNGNEGAPATLTFAPGLPAPPSTLKGVVQGPDVLLSWTLPTDPLRKAIHVYRDGALINNAVAASAVSFLDSAVDNGTHVYEVASEDIFGREGAKSNSVSVTVNDVDLSLASSDLFFLPQQPSEFDNVMLSAVVNNDGQDPTEPVEVRFYDGDPNAGGVLLGSAIAPAMQPGELGLAQYEWPLTGEAGDHLIFAVVDPDNVVVEFYENNNSASKALQVDAVPTMEVTFAEVDASAFPKVVASFQVKDSSGQAVPDLTTRNLTLTEDLVEQIITKLELTSTTTSTQPKVDLVSVIDTSGSMDAELQELPKIMTDVQTQLVLRGVDTKQVNYSMAAALGGVYTPLYKGIFKDVEINISSEDWAPATAWVAKNYPWRADAIRIIVPVSDENCYQGDGQDANDIASLAEAIEYANTYSATVFGLWGEPTSASVQKEHKDLSEGTGGQAFSYTEANKIVDTIVLSVMNKVAVYKLEYTTTNSALDGTLRALQLVAQYRNAEGTGDGEYRAPSSGKADQAAVQLEFIPGNPVAGQTASLKGTVANLGSALTDAVVHLYPSLTSTTPVVKPVVLEDLEPAEVRSFTVPWLAVPGTYQLRMVVDPENVVAESREDNNQVTTQLVVPGNPVAELALYADELEASPTSLVEGETVTLSAVVRNLGIATQDVLVQFYRGAPGDGEQLGDDLYLPSLAAQGATRVEMPWNSSGFDGEVSFTVVVDPLDRIAELREDNNQASLTLPVEGRPLKLLVELDQTLYPAQTPVQLSGKVESRQATAFTGTVSLEIRDAQDQLIDTLSEVALEPLPGAIMPDHRYYVPVTLPAFALLRGNQLASASIHFTQALTSVGRSGTFNPASLRVVEVNASGERIAVWPARGIPNPGYDASSEASMTVLWNPRDVTRTTGERYFRIYFDTVDGETFTPDLTSYVGGELLAVTTETGDVRISRKGADGFYSSLSSVASFGTRVRVALADLNLDGLLDVVAYDQNRDLYYLAGKTDGSFAARVLLSETTSTIVPSDVFVGDFNQDGKPDVVVTEQNATPRLFLQGPNLSFVVSSLSSANTTIYASEVADLNADGQLDLLVAQNTGLISYYPGNGNGTFGAVTSLCDTPGSVPYGFSVADVDGDGTLDLISNQGPSGNTYVCRGNLTGPTFGSPTEITSLKTLTYAAFADMDFNGDGKRDVVIATYSNPKNAQVNLGNGDGTFPLVLQLGSLGGDGLNVAVSNGQEQSAKVGVPSLNPIPTANFSASWNTGLHPAGDYYVLATLLEHGDERTRTQVDFSITALEQLLSSIVTDRPVYGLNELVQLTSRVQNETLNALLDTLEAVVSIHDPAGVEVFSETFSRDLLLVGEVATWQSYFDVGAGAPGTYIVSLEATAGGTSGSAQTSFEVSSSAEQALGLIGSLSLEPTQGLPGAVLASSWQVQNQGNSSLGSVPLRLLLSPKEVEQTLETFPLGSVVLPVGGTEADVYALDTTDMALGDYTLVLQAEVSAGWRSLALAEFRLVNLLGTLTAAPSLLEGGVDAVALSWTVENGADATLSQLSVLLTLFDAAGLEVTTLPQTTEDLPGDSTLTGEDAYDSSLLTLGDYSAVLSVVLGGVPLELAQASFSVGDTRAPLSQLTFEGRVVEQEGQRYMPSATLWVLSATDNFAGVASIGWSMDGRVVELYASPLTFEEGVHTFTWQATDKAGNVEPLHTQTAVVDDSAPVITLKGVAEGLCFPESVTPTVEVTDLSPVTTTLTLDGQPFSGGAITGAGTHTLEVHARDILDHEARETVKFRIETGDCACETGDSVADQDGDGQKACEGDCNDLDPEVNENAPETTDGKDNDCDGLVDEGLCPLDADGDGFATSGGDCDDEDAALNPGALETADGLDNNCDGKVDEPSTDLADADGDGSSRSEGDCNDSNPATKPGAAENASDGQDNNCNGQVDETRLDCDADGDGFSELEGDCDDSSASTYPGADDACDAVDQDCDGIAEESCATPTPTPGPETPTATPDPHATPTATLVPEPSSTPDGEGATPTIWVDITASPDPDDIPSGCNCSTSPVPSEGTAGMLLLGLGWLWRRRRKQTQKQQAE